MSLTSILRTPETRGIDLDSPEAVPLHKHIILSKTLLRRLYQDHYEFFRAQAAALRGLPGELLEIGSGGGFLKDVMPEVITSDVSNYPTVDRVVLADHLPFDDGSLKAIFLLNVLHHLPEPDLFFKEAERCLVKGGRVIMVEPFNSVMGRLVYKHFHHEPFDETAVEWHVAGERRLTASNQALPWIIFWRDRALFESRHPDLAILERTPHTFLRYVLSGGLTWRSFMPGAFYPLIRWSDAVLSTFPMVFPIFQSIILEKR